MTEKKLIKHCEGKQDKIIELEASYTGLMNAAEQSKKLGKNLEEKGKKEKNPTLVEKGLKRISSAKKLAEEALKVQRELDSLKSDVKSKQCPS